MTASHAGFYPTARPDIRLERSSIGRVVPMAGVLFAAKRQFSLETIGLLQLGYPELAKITSVPAVAAQHGVTLEEWRALVQVTLDFHIRGSKSVAIPRDMLRWIGYPGVPTLIIAPGQTKNSPNQRLWPSARTAVTRRSRLVRLLVYTLRLDLETRADQTLIEEFLHALWEAVRPLLSRTESGYYLEPGPTSRYHASARSLALPGDASAAADHVSWYHTLSPRKAT